MKNKIIVVGAGAWGTALANLLAQNNSAREVCLIANKIEISDEINQQHSNQKFLPNIALSSNLKSSQNLEEEALKADFIFVVTPSTATAELLQKIAQFNLKTNCGLVICSKGLETSSLKFFHQIVEEILSQKNYAILSGPNFAAEVAGETPTITTIAAKKTEFAQEVANLLNNKYFKAEISNDVVAAEICAIVKNIMAIGCGIVDGLGFGQNTKAALVTQGIAEIKILCQNFSSNGEINNAAGFGDIFLTCASTKSRNNSLGLLIAQEKQSNIDKNKTYEGMIGAKALAQLATKLEITLPLCKAINNILQNNFSRDEIKLQIIGAIFQ